MRFKTCENNGITLIALIITIIVMLILVGVTITVAMQGGLFDIGRGAAKDTQIEGDKETLQGAVVAAYNVETGKIESAQRILENLPKGWTVEGTGPYICTSPNPNGNEFKVTNDGEIKEPSTGDLELLEKYFLGEDGKGRNMRGDVMDNSLSTFNPYDKMPEFSEEKLEFLNYGDAKTRTEGDKYYEIYEFYVKYENVGYGVKAHFDIASSGEEIITESVEKVYEPKGREGKDLGEVTGNSQYNGWTILYDNGNEVEAVAPDVVGENLELGYNDETAQTPGDVDKDGTANTKLDKAIHSYNNAVKTINDYCKNLTGLPTNIGVRSVGTNPSNPYAENTTPYESEDLRNWDKKYNKLGFSSDANYEEDIIRMSYHKTAKINKQYWLASRFVYSGPRNVNFAVKCVQSDDYFSSWWLWTVYSGGADVREIWFGVRPIIKVSNI